MEYAPEIGGLGLDMEAVSPRLEVFKEVFSLQGTDDHVVRVRMDATIPYIPENNNYKVVSLFKGSVQLPVMNA